MSQPTEFKSLRGRDLTPDQLRRMLQAKADGVAIADIAYRFGVSRRTVHDVLRNERERGAA